MSCVHTFQIEYLRYLRIARIISIFPWALHYYHSSVVSLTLALPFFFVASSFPSFASSAFIFNIIRFWWRTSTLKKMNGNKFMNMNCNKPPLNTNAYVLGIKILWRYFKQSKKQTFTYYYGKKKTTTKTLRSYLCWTIYTKMDIQYAI